MSSQVQSSCSPSARGVLNAETAFWTNHAATDCPEAKMLPFRNKRKLLILESGFKYLATAKSIRNRIGLSRWKSLAPSPAFLNHKGVPINYFTYRKFCHRLRTLLSINKKRDFVLRFYIILHRMLYEGCCHEIMS